SGRRPSARAAPPRRISRAGAAGLRPTDARPCRPPRRSRRAASRATVRLPAWQCRRPSPPPAEGSREEEHLSELLALLDDALRLRRLGERQPGMDSRVELPRGDQVHDELRLPDGSGTGADHAPLVAEHGDDVELDYLTGVATA